MNHELADKNCLQLDAEEIEGEVSEIVRVLPNREPHHFFKPDCTLSATRNRIFKQDVSVEHQHNPFQFGSGREFKASADEGTSVDVAETIQKVTAVN